LAAGGVLGLALRAPRLHLPIAAPEDSAEDGAADDLREPPAVATSFAQDAAPFLTRDCLKCHAAQVAPGGVTLETLSAATVSQDLGRWRVAARAVRSGRMPPPGKPRPAPAETDALLSWFRTAAYQAECAGPRDPGRVALRRLNRAEYNNTVRDL